MPDTTTETVYITHQQYLPIWASGAQIVFDDGSDRFWRTAVCGLCGLSMRDHQWAYGWLDRPKISFWPSTRCSLSHDSR